MESKKGNSYDILKFLMSLLIVAIHTKAFSGAWVCDWVQPIVYVAVPIFFILSSMFYFRKIANQGVNRFTCLRHYLSRLSVLYLFWFIVNILFIQHSHHYFNYGGGADVIRLFYDILLRSTYSGSWFFSALALAVSIYTLIYPYKIIRRVTITISLLLLIYVIWNDLLPAEYNVVYKLLQVYIRQDINLSVCTSLGWCGIGVIMGNPMTQAYIQKVKQKNRHAILLSISTLLTIIYIVNYNFGISFLNIILLIMISISYIMTAGTSNMPQSKKLLKFRKMSTLFYMLHFIVIFVSSFIVKLVSGRELQSLPDYVGFIPGYIIVLFVCLLLSLAIIKLSDYKFTHWLKFSY